MFKIKGKIKKIQIQFKKSYFCKIINQKWLKLKIFEEKFNPHISINTTIIAAVFYIECHCVYFQI